MRGFIGETVDRITAFVLPTPRDDDDLGAVLGIAHGHTWRALEEGIVHGISLSMAAVLILLVVGALIGSWILAGIVPTMIYYGLQLLTPAIFFPSACALCCRTTSPSAI